MRDLKTGIIVFLHYKGYGFIEIRPGDNRFFHASELRGIEFKDLRVGNLVEYKEEQSEKGLQAIEVKVTGY